MGHRVEGDAGTPALTHDVAREVAQTMQALATPSRVLILGQLCDRPRAVGDLAEAIGMEQSAVSHQLRMLRHLGLVVGERLGRNVVYALHDDHVATLLAEAVYHTEHVRLGITDRRAKAPAS